MELEKMQDFEAGDLELQRYFEDPQIDHGLDVVFERGISIEEKEATGAQEKITEESKDEGKDLTHAECEEGEVEEDVAEYINSNSKNLTQDGSLEHDDHQEEDEGMPETMEDSDPLSSSDDEEDEDWRAIFKKDDTKMKTQVWNSDDEDEEPDLPKTKNEILDRPVIPRPDVQLLPNHQVIPIGKVLSVMADNTPQIVIEGNSDHSALDEGSLLWLVEQRLLLGAVDEVFGPVKQPFYLVRFNDENEMPELEPETLVGFVPEFAKTVLKTAELFKKGYDASGVNDEELSDHEEFSDDEKEAEYRRMKKPPKRGGREGSQRKQQTPENSYRAPQPAPQPTRNFDGNDGSNMAWNNRDHVPQQQQQMLPPGFWPGQMSYYPGNYHQQMPPMGPPGYDMNQGMQYPGYYGMPMPGYSRGPAYSQGPVFSQTFAPNQGWVQYQTTHIMPRPGMPPRPPPS